MVKKAKKNIPSRVLEQNQRLSQSILWDLQNRAYQQFGPSAWSQKGVPFYLTSNPYTADRYANVVLGYLRDCLTPQAQTPIDPDYPVYIFDLGAGTGRFCYLFLKHFIPLIKEIFREKICIRYIMTDIVTANINFCQNHSYLQEYIERGIIDFAIYHHEDQKPLHLINANVDLSLENVRNPIILIANYFFNTIPQDFFRTQKGNLEEGRISISVEDSEETKSYDSTSPGLIPFLQCNYNYFPIENIKEYYSQHLLNTTLLQCCRLFNDITFLFPYGAFQTIEYFSKLSQNRLLVLAGDQGVSSPEQVQQYGEPKIAKHGSFSIAINYHIMAFYFKGQNGLSLLTSDPDPLFIVFGGILGGDSKQFPETVLAFRENIDSFEPKDYWKFIFTVENDWKKPSLDFLIYLFKLGNWDPVNLHLFFDSIRQQLPKASSSLKKQLSNAIHNSWDQFYPVSPEEGDFILNMGVLFFEMQDYSAALLFFQRSLKLTGEKPTTLRNMAACYHFLHDQKNAGICLQRARASCQDMTY